MNNRQKTALALGLFGVVATVLYPPWAVTCPMIGITEGVVPIRGVAFAFLFDPPMQLPNPPPNFVLSRYCSVSLDVSVLLTVWVAVFAITCGLALLFGLKKQEPQP